MRQGALNAQVADRIARRSRANLLRYARRMRMKEILGKRPAQAGRNGKRHNQRTFLRSSSRRKNVRSGFVESRSQTVLAYGPGEDILSIKAVRSSERVGLWWALDWRESEYVDRLIDKDINAIREIRNGLITPGQRTQ